MLNPKVGDTLVYKSDADKAAFINRETINEKMHKDYYNDGFYVGCIGCNGDIYSSLVINGVTIFKSEYKKPE